MSYFTCPYCSMGIAVNSTTSATHNIGFQNYGGNNINAQLPSCIQLQFYECPHCGEYTIKALGIGSAVHDVDVPIRPLSAARHYPDYVPLAVRNDYEEACAIVNYSPKAAATLARRCLQGMIRDFWDIKENRLIDAIMRLKDKVPAIQWEVIDKIRQLGNIGAHMEKDINLIVDIDPDETQKLLSLIEFFIDQWYIERHKRDELFGDILAIAEDKQNQRNTT